MADEQRRLPTLGEGLKNGIGLLSAFKEAIEETIASALENGQMDPGQAKEAMSDALQRANAAPAELAAPAAPALPAAPAPAAVVLPVPAPSAPAVAHSSPGEWVPRHEFHALLGQVAELRARIAALEARGAETPRPPLPEAPPMPPPGIPTTAPDEPPGTPPPASPAGPAAS